ncbi:MAG: hypothetical protein IPJ38_06515 [Dechloromonas sp.]|uniref:Uncharacterized protein n=1 Tax=Candidatus Dechloromonas phosphorivorans TaxID=2899244 RepID=A0A935K1N4_9RHOO|nr:hypothetical protein [Candidatus Dechloromonas phosphorivorans]
MDSIIKFTRKLHNYIYTNVQIEEDKKTLLVSGIILGLENDVFSKGYAAYEQELENRICEELLNHIAISLASGNYAAGKDKINDRGFSLHCC